MMLKVKHYADHDHNDVSLLPPAAKRSSTVQSSVDQCIDYELIESTSPDISTRSLIAKWWKKYNKRIIATTSNGREEGTPFSLPESKNPHTLIHSISSHPMVKSFLCVRCDHLHGIEPQTPSVLRSLCECYHILGDIKKALEYIERACNHGDDCHGDEDIDELKWQRAIIRRQYDVQTRQDILQAQVMEKDTTSLPTPMQVERVHCDALSYDRFMTEYALAGTPLIITGLQLTQVPWTMDYISQVIGDKVAPLRCPVRGSVEWAQLESGGEQRVRDFIHDIKNHKTVDRYLFDWSIPEHCPDLAHTLTIPQYFTGDALQATPTGTLYRDSWPSLFVSPGNITSSLHVDAFGSNFWMALFEGRKRWLFFPPEDLPCLYPLYTHSLDPVFQVDLTDPLSAIMYPLLSLTHPRECMLQPGEVLFVPAGSPHQVTSLDPSVAISANYIDRSNITRAMDELEVISLCDPRAGDLLRVLKEKKRYVVEEGIGGVEMKWKDYKQTH